MKCPKCQQALPEKSFSIGTFDDPAFDVAQVLLEHGCGYIGYVLLNPRSFIEVPAEAEAEVEVTAEVPAGEAV